MLDSITDAPFDCSPSGEYKGVDKTLHWRHNGNDDVSNHQPHGCLLTVYSDADKRKRKAPRHWPLCGDFTGTGEFPAQTTSYAKNVSIWWRHHE